MKTILLFIALLFSLIPTWGQEVKGHRENRQPAWYMGLRGGVPFGMSTFTSFGADKTRAGLTGGLYAGYRFNPVFSLEASVAFGQVGLSADKGCASYWLGSDGNRYYAPVAGMQGRDYGDVYSSVTLQQYGVHLNVNVLGLFVATRENRWSVSLSPAVYAVGTKATIKTIADKQTALQGENMWHLGIGGDVMAEYAITKNLSAGIYTGITHLTGKKMDGMPQYTHNSNLIWESGVRIGWTFGKRGGRTCGTKVTVYAGTVTTLPADEPESVVSDDETLQSSNKVQIADKAVTTPTGAAEIFCSFPTIYFDFNKTSVDDAELSKLREILVLLEQRPEMEIIVTGWCDTTGTDEVNARISRQRAETVKTWLTSRGIAATRIITLGKGMDKQATDAAKARRVETTHNKKK